MFTSIDIFMRMRFTGFRQMCEAEEQEDQGDFQKSNMDKVLARDLNILPGNNDDKMDMVAPGGAVEFKGEQLKRLNQLLGFDGPDTAMKLVRVINRNDYGVQLEDITGGCDKDMLNKGQDSVRFGDRFFPHAPCSPTHGQKFWVSAKDWDYLRMPLPPGGGGAGGGLGGPPGGGLGGPPMGGPPPGGPPPPPGGGGPPPPV